jgi:hypothetical protein
MGSNFVDRADRSYAGALRSARERAPDVAPYTGRRCAVTGWRPSTRRPTGVRRVMRELNRSAEMPRESRSTATLNVAERGRLARRSSPTSSLGRADGALLPGGTDRRASIRGCASHGIELSAVCRQGQTLHTESVDKAVEDLWKESGTAAIRRVPSLGGEKIGSHF